MMAKITIQDIAKTLIERNGLSKKEASTFVNAMFDIIKQALERDRIVKVKGFGTFKIIDVDARESVNVNTGERVLIEGHDKITFIPDALMKELVNKPFSQFDTVVLKDGVDFDDEEEGKASEDSKTTEVSEAAPLVEFGDSINLKPVLLGEPAPKPASEPEPKSESKPVSEPVEEPSQKPSDEHVEDPVQDVIEEEPLYDWEEETSDNKKWWIALAACLLGLIGGYLLGSYYPLSKFTSQNDIQLVYPDTVKVADVQEVVDTLEDVLEPVDSAEIQAAIQEAKVEEEAPKPEVKAEEKTSKPEVKAEPQSQSQLDDMNAKYAAMDVRVRTGAYRIVGTDRVVTAKEGDNIVKIARRVLGPDMECYLEVYNGLKASSELKAGQEIKIPKLQWKKGRKSQRVK
jgi:nucleoid DNA-binding protein